MTRSTNTQNRKVHRNNGKNTKAMWVREKTDYNETDKRKFLIVAHFEGIFGCSLLLGLLSFFHHIFGIVGTLNWLQFAACEDVSECYESIIRWRQTTYTIRYLSLPLQLQQRNDTRWKQYKWEMKMQHKTAERDWIYIQPSAPWNYSSESVAK